MKIRLRRTWFAPDMSGAASNKYIGRNGRPIARGHRLRKGIHVVPDEWEQKLPSDAQVLEGPYQLEEDEVEYALATTGSTLATDGLKTVEGAALEQLATTTFGAEAKRQAEIKANRQAGAARAREAKKQKEQDADGTV